jgi:hypothetical protein
MTTFASLVPAVATSTTIAQSPKQTKLDCLSFPDGVCPSRPGKEENPLAKKVPNDKLTKEELGERLEIRGIKIPEGPDAQEEARKAYLKQEGKPVDDNGLTNKSGKIYYTTTDKDGNKRYHEAQDNKVGNVLFPENAEKSKMIAVLDADDSRRAAEFAEGLKRELDKIINGGRVYLPIPPPRDDLNPGSARITPPRPEDLIRPEPRFGDPDMPFKPMQGAKA